MTRWVLAPAPRGASMRSWDCAFCSHEDLVRPVFLAPATGGAVVAAGTGCALNALAPGRTRPPSDDDRRILHLDADRLTRQARADEDLRAERRARYATALHEFAADPNSNPPALGSCRRTYWQAGGYDALGLTFPMFLLGVALWGYLPDQVPAP